MSIFSKLKNSKKAAAQHKADKAAEAKAPPPAPYKHVPTHARVDAVSGAPSSWKASDRAAIKEANKKRMSTVNSSTTLASYNSRPPLSRNDSLVSKVSTAYSSYTNATTTSRSSVSFSNAPRAVHLGYASYAGFEAPRSRVRSFHGKSPLASHPMTSTESHSSSASSRSSDYLELSNGQRGKMLSPPPSSRPQSHIPPRNYNASSGESSKSSSPVSAHSPASKSFSRPLTITPVAPLRIGSDEMVRNALANEPLSSAFGQQRPPQTATSIKSDETVRPSFTYEPAGSAIGQRMRTQTGVSTTSAETVRPANATHAGFSPNNLERQRSPTTNTPVQTAGTVRPAPAAESERPKKKRWSLGFGLKHNSVSIAAH